MVAEAATVQLETSFRHKEAGPGVQAHIAKVLQIGEPWAPPAGYVEGPDDGLFGASSAVNVSLQSRGASVATTMRVRIAEDLTARHPYRIDWPPYMEQEPLELTLDQVYPEISGTAQRSLALWADRALDRIADLLLADLGDAQR
jgi:hypothetical protein